MLDRQLSSLLAQSRAAGLPDFNQLTPQESRHLYKQICSSLGLAKVNVTIEDRIIDGPASPLTIRIYSPKTPVPEGLTRGLILYLHGGGFVVGDPDCYDGICSNLCAQTDCIVLQVDYRLAPEYPFPAAILDCYAALLWANSNAVSLGSDPARMAVAGDSAGGNIAAVLAIMARDQKGPALRYQVLIYPTTASAPNLFPSYGLYGEDYVLTTRAARSFHEHYFGKGKSAPDFRGAPLITEDVSNLPPALVIVARYDILRDEGIAYAQKLDGAGNHVVLVEYLGMSHGFISQAGVLDAGKQAIGQIGVALRNVLNG